MTRINEKDSDYFSKIQTSSLPRNTNSVTTSEPNFVTASKSKLPQNLNFVTASELKFGSITKTENSIETVKCRSENPNLIKK